MSQKHARFSTNKKYREDKSINEYYKPRRPILFSSDDVERMAVERSRAKLIRQLVSKPPESSGEFSSYFCGPSSQLIDPVYAATSHTTHDQELLHKSAIPTYQSEVNTLRWNGTTEPTSVYNCQLKERQKTGESSNFTCRCKECGGKHCRGQSGADLKPRIFRDNITKFADNATMTPKLNDACCGSCTPVTTTRKTSAVSVSSSDVAIRENTCAMEGVSQVYINCDPVSILKKKKCESVMDYKPEDDDTYCAQTEKRCRIADDFQEAVRDTEDDAYYEVNSSKPLRSFPKIVRNKPPDNLFDSEPRKNIYNEGISDLTINLLPTAHVYPERYQALNNIKPGHSRNSFQRKVAPKRDEMPFSHNTESRYHYSCRIPQPKPYYGSNENTERETFSKKFKKTYSSKPMPNYNTESVKYPRKVLTSERDIDSYVGGQFMKVFNR